MSVQIQSKKIAARFFYFFARQAFIKERFFFADKLYKKLDVLYYSLDAAGKMTSFDYWRWAIVQSRQAGGLKRAVECYQKASAHHNSTARFFIDYLKVLDATGKLTAAALGNCLDTIAYQHLSSNHQLALLLLANKYGLCQQARLLLSKLPAEFKQRLTRRYLGLRNIEEVQQFVASTEKHRLALIAYLKRHRGKIALVGNSPVNVGQNQGHEIDAHQVVIRFNNYNTEAEYANDYGQKTSVWVRGGNKRLQERCMADLKFIVFALRDILYRDHDTQPIEDMLANGQHATYMALEEYHELIERLGSYPSTGILMLYFIHKHVGGLSKNNVFGFSFIDHLNEGVSSHYFEKHQTNLSHNWRAERALYDEIVGI